MYTTHQARPQYEIVKGHRWVLPAIAKAQKSRTLPQTCLLISFDRHADAVDVGEERRSVLSEVRDKGTPVDLVERVC